ncbi:MAG: hypothetical protein CMB80_16240 [Flammeovirgaceae bacterium]|nr:hypothetical protein [Flammeovirgaceae bacterium]|tara:strand:- start:2281 stop:2676 length:396 start_codon:yes stop_codon:yes gene_type:complete
MLQFLDLFLTVFHSAFVLFVVFGWTIPKFRKYHVTAILLTLVAWLLLGLYKGVIGYCPLTDWHWDVKRALGETNIPSSFIEYMVEKILGLNFPSLMIDVATVTGLVFGVVMSVVVYHKNVKSHSKEPHQMA